MKPFDYNKYLKNNRLLKEMDESNMEEAKPLKPLPKSKWGKPSADTWFSDVQYFIDTHKYEKLKPTDVIGIGDEEMTYADALKKYAGKMREGDMEEGQQPWDFLVYDMNPYLAGKLKGAAKKLGVSLKIDEYNPAEWEIRIRPNNEKTFKIVFKMLEKTGLDFEESHGMFSGGMKEGNMEEANLNEAKTPDFVIPANDSYDLDEEADYMASILDDAGIMAKCKAGFGEVEVYLANKMDKKKAIRAIENAGYQVDWN